jgi:hypothetical protein
MQMQRKKEVLSLNLMQLSVLLQSKKNLASFLLNLKVPMG